MKNVFISIFSLLIHFHAISVHQLKFVRKNNEEIQQTQKNSGVEWRIWIICHIKRKNHWTKQHHITFELAHQTSTNSSFIYASNVNKLNKLLGGETIINQCSNSQSVYSCVCHWQSNERCHGESQFVSIHYGQFYYFGRKMSTVLMLFPLLLMHIWVTKFMQSTSVVFDVA